MGGGHLGFYRRSAAATAATIAGGVVGITAAVAAVIDQQQNDDDQQDPVAVTAAEQVTQTHVLHLPRWVTASRSPFIIQCMWMRRFGDKKPMYNPLLFTLYCR